MTNAAQEQFLTTAPGQWFDPDGMYGYQCKDLADAYAMAVFGRPWSETIRPGDGHAVFENASPDYFTKVKNNPSDPNQIPPRGAIINWDGSAAVPEGHVAVVLDANADAVLVVQQNGYTQTAAEAVWLPYTLPGGAVLDGWLIPRVADDVQIRIITGDPTYVRTGPGRGYAHAPGFPEGIAKGSPLAVVGYVKGEDPYNTGDDAWYKTKSGYYVWANGAGDDLSGLAYFQ